MALGRIKIETEIELGIDVAAKWFAGLDDDEQSKFFVAVCRAIAIPSSQMESQWMAIGNHLATCECSTEDAREMIRSIVYGMDHPWTKPEVNLLEKAIQVITST
jgi:hypothetical protein